MFNLLSSSDDDFKSEDKRDKVLDNALCVNKFLAVTFFLVAGLFGFIFAFLYFGPDTGSAATELNIFALAAFLVLLGIALLELYNI